MACGFLEWSGKEDGKAFFSKNGICGGFLRLRNLDGLFWGFGGDLAKALILENWLVLQKRGFGGEE